jgi:4,5-dihydroxyphthalate decarboxylase
VTETTLRAAIGTYPETAALLEGRVAAPGLGFDFHRPFPITKAFAPMVRQAAYDVSEMAIATFLMARAFDKPMVLLPIVLAARFQEKALLCRRDGPIQGPADLRGTRIAVRAYSQTTGMWLRGSLSELHGVKAEAQAWTTFEDAHVQEFRDPPFVTRAAPGQDLLGMLQSGAVDAAIFGNELPDDPNIGPVFRDLPAAGEAFRARYGFEPVNHLVVVRREVAQHAPALVELFRTSGARIETRASLNPAIEVAIRFCREQGLINAPLSLDQVWAGLPAEVA